MSMEGARSTGVEGRERRSKGRVRREVEGTDGEEERTGRGIRRREDRGRTYRNY